MEHIYHRHHCLISVHKLIGIPGIYEAFEGHICYWYIYG